MLLSQNNQHYLGIDFGTSGCRAIAIDQNKQILASAIVTYQHEQNPQLWWSSFELLISQLKTTLDLSSISRMALDATSGTVLLANNNGEPKSQVVMYNDACAELESSEIQQLVPDNAALHSSSSGISKMLWLKRHYQPDATDKYLHQADWILGQLTGNYSITDYNNALKSGIDITTKQWPSWIEKLGIQPQQLPTVTKPGTLVGKIRTSIASQLGFSTQLNIVSGCTDSTAAVIATGAKKIGEAISSLGSTLVVKIISDRPISSSEFGIYSQPYNSNFLVGGSSNTGGAVLKHFFSPKQMREMSKLINPNESTGLNYYPLIQNGERFPFNDANHPAKLEPRPVDDIEFFKGMLEGIAEIEFQCYQKLEQMGCPNVKQIYNMGGGSQNPVWTQIRQSRLGIPIVTPENTEAAYGAALLAYQSE